MTEKKSIVVISRITNWMKDKTIQQRLWSQRQRNRERMEIKYFVRIRWNIDKNVSYTVVFYYFDGPIDANQVIAVTIYYYYYFCNTEVKNIKFWCHSLIISSEIVDKCGADLKWNKIFQHLYTIQLSRNKFWMLNSYT